MNMLSLVARIYVPILIGGLLAIGICLVARRRNWSKWLCLISLAGTGLLLLMLSGLFVQGAIVTHGYHGEAGMAGSLLFLAGIPVALEFFGLLALAWRLGLPGRAPTRPPKEPGSLNTPL
jgi:hypothetical protein